MQSLLIIHLLDEVWKPPEDVFQDPHNTELRVSTSLAKIEAQTEALQKLSGRQIDKLMKHAFDDSSQSAANDAMMQLMNTLFKYQLLLLRY